MIRLWVFPPGASSAWRRSSSLASERDMRLGRVVAYAVGLFLVLPVWAQTPQTAAPVTSPAPPPHSEEKTPPATPAGAHVLEPADLQPFFDGIIQMQLERSD